MTTTSTDPFRAWWNTAHDHSRCWWNWEDGRWICPPTVTATSDSTSGFATSASGSAGVSPTPQGQA